MGLAGPAQTGAAGGQMKTLARSFPAGVFSFSRWKEGRHARLFRALSLFTVQVSACIMNKG